MPFARAGEQVLSTFPLSVLSVCSICLFYLTGKPSVIFALSETFSIGYFHQCDFNTAELSLYFDLFFKIILKACGRTSLKHPAGGNKADGPQSDFSLVRGLLSMMTHCLCHCDGGV